jgi:hypothetical protein
MKSVKIRVIRGYLLFAFSAPPASGGGRNSAFIKFSNFDTSLNRVTSFSGIFQIYQQSYYSL